MIRALRPTDLAGLSLLLRRMPTIEVTAHTWPTVQPESGHLPLQQVLWQSLGQAPTRGRAWVAMEEGRIVGLAVARARCGGLVWDVEHLHVVEDGGGGLESLLDHVCQQAAAGGARRVLLEISDGTGGAEIARRAGFERYTESSVYRLTPPFGQSRAEQFAGRPRLQADEHGLFQLYNAAVPAVVRSAEAVSHEEWSGLHRGRNRWAPTLVGDRHQYVWELGEGLAGWLEVVYGQKSQYLEFMVHPKYESMMDRFVGYGLRQVSEKAAVYSAVRGYQGGLGLALERVGFESAGRYDLYVRQLTVRVPKLELASAQIVGG